MAHSIYLATEPNLLNPIYQTKSTESNLYQSKSIKLNPEDLNLQKMKVQFQLELSLAQLSPSLFLIVMDLRLVRLGFVTISLSFSDFKLFSDSISFWKSFLTKFFLFSLNLNRFAIAAFDYFILKILFNIVTIFFLQSPLVSTDEAMSKKEVFWYLIIFFSAMKNMPVNLKWYGNHALIFQQKIINKVDVNLEVSIYKIYWKFALKIKFYSIPVT